LHNLLHRAEDCAARVHGGIMAHWALCHLGRKLHTQASLSFPAPF
jgi:hypothetical protein